VGNAEGEVVSLGFATRVGEQAGGGGAVPQKGGVGKGGVGVDEKEVVAKDKGVVKEGVGGDGVGVGEEEVDDKSAGEKLAKKRKELERKAAKLAAMAAKMKELGLA